MWKQTVSCNWTFCISLLLWSTQMYNIYNYYTDIYITVNALYHCIGFQAGGRFSWKIPASIHQLARDRCRSGIANMSQPSVWSGARSPQEFEPHSLVCGCPTLCGERISQRVTFSVLLIVSQVTRRISGGLKGREKDWKMSSTIDMTEEEFYKEVYDYGTLWLGIRIWAWRWK